MFQESLCEIRAERKSLYRTLDVLNFVGNEKKKKNWCHSEETKHFHLQMTFRSDKFLRKKKRALFYPPRVLTCVDWANRGLTASITLTKGFGRASCSSDPGIWGSWKIELCKIRDRYIVRRGHIYAIVPRSRPIWGDEALFESSRSLHYLFPRRTVSVMN